ncbi:hypothetical protein T552_01613 [Pneumocystis carinii B80]|uniref:Nucleoporin n=1 Tax=Pneumocystis carinii (strain B80) TaxID=1408658 RepID=A0A0W4ZL28_PNEC8|nr:hypothetical protein T552_01613 [Pneumocystis carinii B80]KTW28982.1 hypothetical protein T552_01613 [Pneumocystis carinii B80]
MLLETWDPDNYKLLYDTLLNLSEGTVIPESFLEHLLESFRQDFKNLLQTPKKSEQSLEKLKSGIIYIDGIKYKLNDTFISEALHVSNKLNLDEILSAKLVHYGIKNSKNLDRSVLQTSLFLFYSRKKYLLNSLSIILLYAKNELGNREILKYFKQTVQFIFQKNSENPEDNLVSYSMKCLQAMEDLRTQISNIFYQKKNKNFNEYSQNDEYIEEIKLKKESMLQEHEIYGILLYRLSNLNMVNINDFEKIIHRISLFDEYDLLITHFFPVIINFIALGGEISSQSEGELENFTNYDIEILCKINKIINLDYQNEKKWAIEPLKSIIQLWWTTKLNRICKKELDISMPFKYSSDIYNPSREAISSGAFETMIKKIMDVLRFETKNLLRLEDYKLLLNYPKFKEGMEFPELTFSKAFQEIMFYEIEKFIYSFISDMPDLLKNMKLVEEDLIMTQKSLDFNADDKIESSLEAFFYLIALVYENREDSALLFWLDRESDLYGFILWSSQCQTPLMITAFSTMLASLGNGPQCSTYAYDFLTETKGMETMKAQNNMTTWEYIFDTLKYYVSQLKITHFDSSLSSSRMLTVAFDFLEIDHDSRSILRSYFHLITCILSSCPDVSNMVYKKYNPIPILFDLLNCQLSSDMYCGILLTLTSFLSGKELEIRDTIWNLLDQWICQQNNEIYLAHTSYMAPNKFNESLKSYTKIDQTLRVFVSNSLSLAIAFVLLLNHLIMSINDLNNTLPFPESIGLNRKDPGIQPFIDLVMDLFLTSNSLILDNKLEGLQLFSECLKFIQLGLKTFNLDIVEVASLNNIEMNKFIKTSSFSSYLNLHPGNRIMQHMYRNNIYICLFDFIHIALEVLQNTESDPLWLLCLDTSLNILDLVLHLQLPFLEWFSSITTYQSTYINSNNHNKPNFETFEDIMLFHLNVIVYICLCIGFDSLSVSKTAVSILKKLSDSPQLTDTKNYKHFNNFKRNRLLGILETVDESKKIRFGAINLIQIEQNRFLNTSHLDQDTSGRFFLKFLAWDLQKNQKIPTVSHFFLGFQILNDGTSDIGTERGEIGSEISILHCLLSFIQNSSTMEETLLDSPKNNLSNTIMETVMHIIFLLSKSELTSDIMYDILKKRDDILLKLLSPGPLTWILPKLDSSNLNTFSSKPVKILLYRSWLLHTIAIKLRKMILYNATTLQKCYTKALTFYDEKNKNSQNYYLQSLNKGIRILKYLDILELDITTDDQEFILEKTQQMFSNIPRSSNSLYDIKKIKTYMKLKACEFQNKDFDNKRKTFTIVEKDIISQIEISNILIEINNAKLLCFQGWNNLLGILLEDCAVHLTQSQKDSLIIESLRILTPKLTSFSKKDENIIEICSSSVLILIRHITQNTIFEEKYFLFLKNILLGIQNPNTNETIRQNLYIAVIFYLDMVSGLELQSNQSHKLFESYTNIFKEKKNPQIIKPYCNQLIHVICRDAIYGSGMLKMLSYLILNLAGKIDTIIFFGPLWDTLIHQNYLNIFITSLWESEELNALIFAEFDNSLEGTIIEAKLNFILKVSQTKIGAQEILKNELFDYLIDKKDFIKNGLNNIRTTKKDHQNILNRYIHLICILLRILISCMISLGLKNIIAHNVGEKFYIAYREIIVFFKENYSKHQIENSEMTEILKITNTLEIILESYKPLIDS